MLENIKRSLKGVGGSNNEDSVLTKVYQTKGNNFFVAAVCDGMGGSEMPSITNLEDGRIYNGSCVLETSNSKSDPVSDNSSFTEKNVIITAIAFVATIVLCFVLIIVFAKLKNYNNTTADSIEKKQSVKQPYVISDNISIADSKYIYEEIDSVNDTPIVASETTIGESSVDEIIVNS